MNNSDQLRSFSEQARLRFNWLMDMWFDKTPSDNDRIISNETHESVSKGKEVDYSRPIYSFLIGIPIGIILGLLVIWILK